MPDGLTSAGIERLRVTAERHVGDTRVPGLVALVARGAEPVDRLLPELARRRVLRRMDGPLDQTVPAARAITTRDLLTFTFGFGMVIEMFMSATPWPVVAAAEVLSTRVFEPLGMRGTGFWTTHTKRLATAYRPTPEGLVVVDDPGGAWSRPPAFGDAAAGLLSTVDDLLAFARMLLGGALRCSPPTRPGR